MNQSILVRHASMSRDLYDGHPIQEGMDALPDESIDDDRYHCERDIEPVIVDVRVDGDDALFQSYPYVVWQTVPHVAREILSDEYSDSRDTTGPHTH
jgi:hypothetical protein